MFDYGSSSIQYAHFLSSIGLFLALSVSVILAALASLMGLGYGVRAVGSWITGFDMSGRIGGFYYARVPWRGYNRWRSRAWNEAHMPD